jgi:hypothetical protein
MRHALLHVAVKGYQTACARGCPDAVAGSQTASLSKGCANIQQQQQQQQQQSKKQEINATKIS